LTKNSKKSKITQIESVTRNLLNFVIHYLVLSFIDFHRRLRVDKIRGDEEWMKSGVKDLERSLLQ